MQDETNTWSLIEDDQILELYLDSTVENEDITNIYISFDLTIPRANFDLDIRPSAMIN